MLCGLFLPIETVIVPLFLIMKFLGITGTHLPLSLEPVFGATAAAPLGKEDTALTPSLSWLRVQNLTQPDMTRDYILFGLGSRFQWP